MGAIGVWYGRIEGRGLGSSGGLCTKVHSLVRWSTLFTSTEAEASMDCQCGRNISCYDTRA